MKVLTNVHPRQIPATMKMRQKRVMTTNSAVGLGSRRISPSCWMMSMRTSPNAMKKSETSPMNWSKFEMSVRLARPVEELVALAVRSLVALRAKDESAPSPSVIAVGVRLVKLGTEARN